MSLAERMQTHTRRSSLTDCWEWQKYRQAEGYGVIRDGDKTKLAHRVAWELHNGRSIPPGMIVRHMCDNPPCCNPAHLRLGTDADNKRDSMAKGRHRWPVKRGESHAGSKLTADQVRAIRADNRPQPQIAADYGITQSHVSTIKNRHAWRHV